MADEQKKSGTHAGKKSGANRSGLIVLAVIAALGWGWGIYQAMERSALETASGELTDIQSQIETSNGELAGLGERLETAQDDFDTEMAALADRTARAESELATLAKRRDAALSEAEMAEASVSETHAQLETQRSELKEIEKAVEKHQTTREETDAALSKVTRELETVGERLEAARAQEGTVRDTLSTLQKEAAEMTKGLADAETRMQEARRIEADAQETSTRITKEVTAFEEKKEQLKQTVSELTARRSDLQSDVSAAEEQRSKVQAELRDLTELLNARSDELLKVERRIVAQQDTGQAAASTTTKTQGDASKEENGAQERGQVRNNAAGARDEEAAESTADRPQDATPRPEQGQSTAQKSGTGENATNNQGVIAPGTYRTGNITARFGPDGVFRMRHEARGSEVTGQYAAEQGVLTLSNPKGDLRRGVRFPLRCAVTLKDKAFILQEAQGEGPSCGPLADANFERVQE